MGVGRSERLHLSNAIRWSNDGGFDFGASARDAPSRISMIRCKGAARREFPYKCLSLAIF